MSKITTVNVMPRRIKDTNRVEWELEIPPNVQGYSVESITGYVFNQCWIEPHDKIKLEIKLAPSFNFEYVDNQDDFGGIFEYEEDMKLHDQGNFTWCYVADSGNMYVRYDKIRGKWYRYVRDDMKDDGSREGRVYAGDFDSLEDLMESGGDYGLVFNSRGGYKIYENIDNQWNEIDINTPYDYCGITPSYPNNHNFGKYIEPTHGDWCYCLITETIWIYDGFEETWENTLARTTVTPLRRLYKMVWDEADDTKMYDDLYPEKDKRFYLHEVQRLTSITISPWMGLFNEFEDPDPASNISKLKHQPNPLIINKTAHALDLDRPEGIDYTRYYFRSEGIDEGWDYDNYLTNLPNTFNSTINTVGRRKIAGGIGFQESKGSSIFDAFMQRLNLHILNETYPYFIRSDDRGMGLDDGEIEQSFYYRFTDFVKFASAEGSYQNNYISWTRFDSVEMPGGATKLIQEFITGSGAFGSSEDTWQQRFYPKLVKTESLKLGGSDVRIVYPTSVMYEQPMTWGIYKKLYKSHIADECEDPPDIFSKIVAEHVDMHVEFDSVRILATRGISFQLFSRDIGWNDDDFAEEGTKQKGPFTLEAESTSIVPQVANYMFKVTCPTFGFFGLWSLQLYVKADDSTNIDSILNYSPHDASGPLVSLTNIVFKFTQTSPGYLWLSNSLPHSKIPVGHNRKIKFELLDMYGRKIPLRDSGTGVHVNSGLEIYLYHEDPPDAN